MPAPTTTDELLDLVRKSELIPAERLETFVEQAALAKAVPTPRELANLLVAGALITQFQAEQFLAGKWRGFSIGKYRVLERLGAGGMGTVYLCEHQMVGRKVAVKVLPTNQAGNPSALARFYREARAAGSLDHPNLVKAHDIDEDNGLHFLVMDYIDGSSLHDVVTKFGALPVDRAIHYVRQAAIGLQHAFKAGLVHRDIKPGNIMVERTGTVRVLDLGLARFYLDQTDLLTLQYDEKNVLGTADYVAPEQALNSHDVDIRADIYSLGATFYFLLTGQPPFVGGKVAQKLIWHQVRHPTPVRQVRPEVPEGAAAVLARMMAKAPAQRFQSPGDVADALAPFDEEPVARPREEEMPKLCPLLAGAVDAATRASNSRQLATVKFTRKVSATRPSGSGRVVAHERAAAGATPRMLASASASTQAEVTRPRREKAIEPARVLERVRRQAERKPLFSSPLSLVVLTLLSTLAGVTLAWALFGR